ncbi:hypothetical protein F652_1155 [Enterobacteriaceae bacterium bta3-1]|nr:hypothetical protein F652_1155 [Enterobacteriaceae bacterium bta3-1]
MLKAIPAGRERAAHAASWNKHNQRQSPDNVVATFKDNTKRW